MPVLTLVFLVACALMVAIRLFLDARQRRTVLRCRDEVPAPFAAHISADEHRRAADYTLAKLSFARADLLVELALLFGLTLGGGISTLDALCGRWFHGAVLHGVGTLLLLGIVMAVVGLPLDAWRTFGLEARFGFNRTTPALYLADQARSLLVSLLIGAPLLAAVLTLMQLAGSLWWFYAWLLWTVFGVVMAWAFPRFIAPLFNRFRPLDDGALRRAVEGIMQRCGYAADGVQVMDGSRRSSHGNAYFTGFGTSKRIVLFDTLVERLTPAEVAAVLAHELGHFRLHHILRRLASGTVVSLVGFALLGALASQPSLVASLGVQPATPQALLALFVLVVPVFTFLLQPLGAYRSRCDEYAADRFAAAHAEAADLAQALVKLYRDNASTLTPDPWYSAFYDSHPSALARIGALQGLRS